MANQINQLNTGALDTLTKGQTLLINARQVSNGKIQLEFAEVLKSTTVQNVLSILNKSDERFSSNARRAWTTAEPSDAKAALGINFGEDAEWYDSQKGKMLDLEILNPTITGVRCRILFRESLEGTDWQKENLNKSAKRKGKEGDFITHGGNYIFSNCDVILTDASTDEMHVYLAPDSVNLAQPRPIEAFAAQDMGMI